jgi:hypothetical protein
MHILSFSKLLVHSEKQNINYLKFNFVDTSSSIVIEYFDKGIYN